MITTPPPTLRKISQPQILQLEIEDTKKYVSSQDKHYQQLTDDQFSDLPPLAWTSQES